MLERIISPILLMTILALNTVTAYAGWTNTGLGWEFRNEKDEVKKDVIIDCYNVDSSGIRDNQICNYDYMSKELMKEILNQQFDNRLYETKIVFTNAVELNEFTHYFKTVYYLVQRISLCILVRKMEKVKLIYYLFI